MRNICYRTVTYFKQDHDNCGRCPTGAAADGTGDHVVTSTGVIFVEKTFSLIFNLSLLTKKSHKSEQNSAVELWVSGQNGTIPVIPDLLADKCVISAEESTENVAKRVLG